MKSWRRSLLYVVIGYLGFVLMLVFLENKLLYHPTNGVGGNWVAPPANSGIEDVDLTSSDGTRIHAWYCPHPTSDEALLYCHGNAGNISWRGNSVVKLRDLVGVSVLIFDYPGYGKSDGSPSEQGCYDAAEAGYVWLTETKKFAPKKTLIYGGSLGGGIAVDLASRKEHRGLVLVKTFTSAPDAACSIYWWLPVPIRSLMTNQFDNVSKIDKCHRPVFVAHGAADEIIPHALGERLFAAAHEPKEFMSIPGNSHNDPMPTEFFTKVRAFFQANPVD